MALVLPPSMLLGSFAAGLKVVLAETGPSFCYFGFSVAILTNETIRRFGRMSWHYAVSERGCNITSCAKKCFATFGVASY